MKKLLIALVAAAAIAGCTESVDSAEAETSWLNVGEVSNDPTLVKVVDVEGHRYVIMRGYKCGGIVHAASCPCLKMK